MVWLDARVAGHPGLATERTRVSATRGPCPPERPASCRSFGDRPAGGRGPSPDMGPVHGARSSVGTWPSSLVDLQARLPRIGRTRSARRRCVVRGAGDRARLRLDHLRSRFCALSGAGMADADGLRLPDDGPEGTGPFMGARHVPGERRHGWLGTIRSTTKPAKGQSRRPSPQGARHRPFPVGGRWLRSLLPGRDGRLATLALRLLVV